MAKIPRKTQKIFAGSAANNGQFGSAQLGTKVTTTDITTIQALSAWDTGWLSATISSLQLPPLEEMQGIQYVATTQLAYLFQEGIPEYDAGTNYFLHSIVKQVGTYKLYGSLIDNNLGNALTVGADWQFLCDLSNPESNIVWGGTAGGTANAITLTPTTALPSYITPTIIMFLPASNNTGATTVNVSGLGLKNVTKGGTLALAPNDIETGKLALAIYDGTQFQLINIPAFAHGADVASATTMILNGTGGDIVNITGTTTVTAITLNEGRLKVCRFAGAVTLTQGASLFLNNNGSNYTTAANDVVIFYGLAAGLVVGLIIPVNGSSPTPVTLPTYAANSFVGNITTSTALPVAVAVGNSQLAGRGSTGNIAAIGIDASLSMVSTVLSVTQASTSQLGGAQTAAASDSSTGTSTTKVMTPAVMKNHKGVAKAWVNFVGSTGSVNASYNISSVTRNSASDYTIAFATSMTDANYTASGMCTQIPNSANSGVVCFKFGTTNTVSSCEIIAMEGAGGGFADPALATVNFFGN